MDKKYIKFIEGDKEDLKAACKLAEQHGYKLRNSPTALRLEGNGILICGSDGDYFVRGTEAILEKEGYTEIKREDSNSGYENVKDIDCGNGTKVFEKKYIKFIEGDKEDLEKACQLAEEHGYKLRYSSVSLRLEGYGVVECRNSGSYLVSTECENQLINNGYTEIKRIREFTKYPNGLRVKVIGCSNNHNYKIGTIITIKNCYDTSIRGGYMYETNEGNNSIGSIDIELIVEFKSEFKVGDIFYFEKCNEINRRVIIEILDESYRYFNINDKYIYTCSNKDTLILLEKKHSDYEFIIKYCPDVLYTPQWRQWCISNNVDIEGVYTGIATIRDTSGNVDNSFQMAAYCGVSDYIIGKGKVERNNFNNNKNTMKKLNELRADKFFKNENNLVAIETLDNLLIDSIDLIRITKEDLNKVQQKLIGLNDKLVSATNNQDVATLKDLISSTKVMQNFVDELKLKTISKFESAKSKFDVAEYLKD